MAAQGKHFLHRLRANVAGGSSGGAFTSRNWDGYFTSEAGSSSNQATFNSVQAQWTVQPVTCDPKTTQSEEGATWVGLDGWFNDSVEQGGTEAICNNGTPSYFTWWEMFPFNFIQLDFAVNPGDNIKANVTFNTSTSEFDITVADVTNGQTLVEDTPCQTGQTCDRSSAEVISEDTGGGTDVDGLFPLPDYGTQPFTNISVTDVNGHTGTLANPNWTANSVTEVSSQNVTKQTTGALSPDGSSFTTTWQAEFGAATPPANSLTADYETTNTSATTNQISPIFEIINNGTTPIPLNSITVRYWFTEDGSQPLQFSCDYSPIGCSNVTGSFVTTTLGGQDHYLQLSFAPGAGSLGPGGGNTGVIQTRFSQTNFANMSQANDYSFNAADTSMTANPHITVYDNGTLIYGTEP